MTMNDLVRVSSFSKKEFRMGRRVSIMMHDGRGRKASITRSGLKCGYGFEVCLTDDISGWATTVMLDLDGRNGDSYMVSCDEAFNAAGFRTFTMEGCPFYWSQTEPSGSRFEIPQSLLIPGEKYVIGRIGGDAKEYFINRYNKRVGCGCMVVESIDFVETHSYGESEMMCISPDASVLTEGEIVLRFDKTFASQRITFFAIPSTGKYWGNPPGNVTLAPDWIGLENFPMEGSTRYTFPGLNNSNSLSTSNMDLMRKYKDSKMSTQDQAFIKAGVTDRQGDITEEGREWFTEWLFNDGTVKQGAKEVKLKDLFFEQVVAPALEAEMEESNNED